MGSTKFSRLAVPLSIVALAVSPSLAAAMTDQPVKDYSQNGATGDYAPQKVFKDYSRNGATGDYTPAVESTASTVGVVKQSQQQSFAWGAAALGAAATLVLVLLSSVTARRVRRRRIGAPTPARPSAA
jgi:hypothetical protein